MTGLAYGVGGLISIPPAPITGNGPPPASFMGKLGQQFFDVSQTPPVEYVYNGQTWTIGGASPATQTNLGTVFLATLAETESGGAPSASYVSSANDVATALAAVVVGAGVPATTAQQGYVFLATNAQAAAGVISTNSAIVPSSLAFALSNAAALPIGNTTAGSGAFSTLAASGTLGVTGASTFSSGAFSTTLGVTGASTFSSGTFSTTLGVTGTSTLGAVTQLGIFSANASGAAATTIGGSSGAITIAVGAGNLAINGNSNEIDIGSDGASTNTIKIGASTGACPISIGGTGANTIAIANTQTGGSVAIGASMTTGTITIGGTAQTTGAITIGESTANSTPVVNIQAGASAHNTTTNIANGITTAGAHIVNLFNAATTSGAGTEALNIMSTTAASSSQTVNILNGANTNTTNTVNIAGAGATGTIVTANICTGAVAHILNLGNATGGTASQVNILVGTGSTPDFKVDGLTTSTYAIGASTTTGTIVIGGTAMTGAGVITLGSSSATSTVKIASGAGASTVTIAEGTAAANTVSIINSNIAAVGTVNILSGTGAAGAAGSILRMANNSRVATIDLGNVAPSAARTVTICGGNAAQNDTIEIMGGNPTANTQKFDVLNGVASGGTQTVNLLSGTPSAGTQTVNIFNGTATGGTLIANIFGSAASATAGTINIGTGAVAVASHVVNIGNVLGQLNVSARTQITLASGAATGLAVDTSAGTGIGATFKSVNATTDAIQVLAGSGGIKVAPTTVGAGASPQTCNNRFGQVVFSGVSIASGATQAFEIDNSIITGAATVVGVWMTGATAGSALSIASAVPAAGKITVTVTNGTSATMVTSIANITFTFWVMN